MAKLKAAHGGTERWVDVRIALENAVSVASVLLLTEATMTEIPSDEKDAAAPSLEA